MCKPAPFLFLCHFYHHLQHRYTHTWLCDHLNYLLHCNIITLTFATVQLISGRYHSAASLICCLLQFTWIRQTDSQWGANKTQSQITPLKTLQIRCTVQVQMQYLPGLVKSIEKWLSGKSATVLSCSPLFTSQMVLQMVVSLSPLSCSLCMQMMIKWKEGKENQADRASVLRWI